MKIPKDNWRGNRTLECEVPWIAPLPIIKLDELLTKDMNVLEFGAGGSTLFFSRRVKFVVSFESKIKWFNVVTQVLNDKSVNNVEIILFKNLKDIEDRLFGNRMLGFHCVMVDNSYDHTKVKRELLLEKSIPLLIPPRIIVLDNWASHLHFPYSYKLRGREFIEWFGLSKDLCVEVYYDDDPKYGAKGTRIFYEEERDEIQ